MSRKLYAVKRSVLAKVDYENNAETFWDALEAAAPKIAKAFERRDEVVMLEEVFDELTRFPGFSDGPAHAPDALLRADSTIADRGFECVC